MNTPGSLNAFMMASAHIAKTTFHNYPAPVSIAACVFEGSQVPMDAALRIESNYFAKLLLDPVSRNLIRTTFINKGLADKLARRPAAIPKWRVGKLGVLGAGMMGAGIAHVSAKAGMHVVLLDQTQTLADQGKRHSRTLLDQEIARGRATEAAAAEVLARIEPTTDIARLSGCDLIIEAVFEARDIKVQAFQRAEMMIGTDTVFASNTSTLPITGLAHAVRRPENFIGVHFFSPVEKMPLVEIIVGQRTSQQTIARALDYVAQLKKTPIVVNDCRGFYANRVFGSYVYEGMAMLAAGVSPALVENAARMAGMPIGPLAVSDEVTIELQWKVLQQTEHDLGEKFAKPIGYDVIRKFAVDLERPGKRFGKGFYDYIMDFTLPNEIETLRTRVREFVSKRIIPLEAEPANYDAHENVADAVLAKLRQEAKAAGLWAPQIRQEHGGLGLSFVGLAALYEEMGRSIFGPVCFNAAAPDDGNMRLLQQVGTAEQKRWWLQPVVNGDVRSSFAMTEPAPGSGSDPAGMMLTRAERVGGRWRIYGRKWFITGAGVAQHFIVLARTSEDPRRGLSAFLFHARQPGWHIERRIPIMGPEEHGGHCELVFDGLEIEDENVLMNIGDGLKATQIRLGPARLTHCMRWLGMAKRAIEISMDYVRERRSVGKTLAAHEGVQWLLGEAAMAIEVGRLLTMRAAWKLDQGDFARSDISMAKLHVSETLHKAVDTSLQLQGARGYSKDTPVEWMYRYARQARLVDGASEVHKMVLAAHALKRGADTWQWGV